MLQECCLCGDKTTTLISTRCRKGTPLRTVICDGCGLVHHDPLPKEQEINLYYEKKYRSDYKNAYSPQFKHVYRAGRVALNRIQKIRPWLTKCQDILDVGSGAGELCYLLNAQGHRCIGIEPNEGYAVYAKDQLGLNIHVGSYETALFKSEAFDLVTMYHVLEHILQPVALLQKVYQWLRPGGFLIVEVPNIEATCVTPKNKFHYAHIYNFNILTLEFVGIKCGFSVTKSCMTEDTGNIRVVFSKTDQTTPWSSIGLRNNSMRIRARLNQHTMVKHYLSLAPYRRPFHKLKQNIIEKMQFSKLKNGTEILDELYESYLT